MPAPNPNISAVRPNSLFIVSAANPTLTRSIKATRKHRIRNGMRRHAALRDARRAAQSHGIAFPRVAASLQISAGICLLHFDVGLPDHLAHFSLSLAMNFPNSSGE